MTTKTKTRTKSRAPDDPEFLLDAGWALVQRAATAEDRARALSTFRRIISTARKQGRETSALLGRLEQLEGAALRLWEAEQDAHIRRAVRALASFRMAVEERLAARAPSRPVEMVFRTHEGKQFARHTQDRDFVMAFYGVPREFWDGDLKVQMGLSSGPDVRVYGPRRKLLWRGPSEPADGNGVEP
jgi:hypothetical protein